MNHHSRFNNLFYALNDLPVNQMRDAILMAQVLAKVTPEAAKLAVRGADILRDADKETRKFYDRWLDEMYKQKRA